MIIWYTVRNKFSPVFFKENSSWEGYIKWSKLIHLTEVISLDSLLCEFPLEIDYTNPITWDYIVTDEDTVYELFTSLEYILDQLKNQTDYNILAVIKEPISSCEKISISNFTFVGYDLIDKDYSMSAITNCGGFDETFLPNDLNNVGLIDEYEKAIEIRKNLILNNPNSFHADCLIFAIWKYNN